MIREARRRQRRRYGFTILAALCAAGLLAGLVASFGSPPPPRRTLKAHASSPRPNGTVVTEETDGLFSWHGPMHTPKVIDTTVGLYLTWVTTRLGDGHRHGDLAKIDPRTGKLTVARAVRGWPLHGVGDDGSLFVAVTAGGPTPQGGRVVRMNPTTLAVTGKWSLRAATSALSLVAAGGAVWAAAGDTIERITAHSGSVTTSLMVVGATSISLGTNTAGTVLVAAASSDATSGKSVLERIDPTTGTVELRVALARAGSVEGIVGTSVWIASGGGHIGTVELYNLANLEPTGPACHTGEGSQGCLQGPAIAARTVAGKLWVTTPDESTRNFCALASGHPVATLPVHGEEVLAIGAEVLFLLTTVDPRSPTVSESSIPAACRAP